MPKVHCEKVDCTFNVTGRCLESHSEPTEQCPNVVQVADQSAEAAKPSASGRPMPSGRRFHQGLELGGREALAVMRSNYTHLVGVLGPTNVGKTCLLTSLYLQASNRRLAPDYYFAGSLTLQGFEHRARRLRQWNQNVIHDKIVDHTILSDPRQPSFVHLALTRSAFPRKHIDLMMSDLPGEWSTNLINRADVANRFEFLARADSVLLVVEGPRLAANATRHQETMNAKHLIRRLADDVKVSRDVNLLLVVSKIDEVSGVVPAEISLIEQEAQRFGYSPRVIPVAAFSRHTEVVPHGTGIADLVKTITVPSSLRDDPLAMNSVLPNRSFFRSWGQAS